MSLHRLPLALVLLATLPPAARAYDITGTASLPAGFGLKPAGPVATVVYAEGSGERFNAISRPTLETICSAQVAQGLASRMPTFEAGDGESNKYENWTFTNSQHSARFELSHNYACDPASSARAPGGICNCNFRVVDARYAHIKNVVPKGVEVIRLDFGKRLATRYVQPGATSLELPALDERLTRASIVHAMAPTVVGAGKFVGIECVIRRQSTGGANYIDSCIAEDPEKLLPPALRMRALSQLMPEPRSGKPFLRSQTDRLVLEATVDAAVFSIPPGFDIKDLP